jgi:mono/diheme cytochrome c family protein
MKVFFKAALLIPLFCFGYLCSASYAGDPDFQDKVPTPNLSVLQVNRAKQLFTERCVRCHGANGRGQTVVGGMLDIPDFTDKDWWNDIEDERLLESVRNGKGGMPKFGKKLSSQQISLLVTYVRRFQKSAR